MTSPSRPASDCAAHVGASYGLPSRSRATSATGNLTRLILDAVAQEPTRPAFVRPEGVGAHIVTYGALAERMGAYQRGLRTEGYAIGDRVLVLSRPTPEFYALALAILASGMTLVLADGRLGAARMLQVLRDARADGVIAPPALMRWWPLVGALRRARRCSIGGRVVGALALTELARRPGALDVASVPADAPAIASFTSGNTGRPKRIVRSHAVLAAQHRALAAAFPLAAGDVTFSAFPVAMLHNLCCGATTVLPSGGMLADPAALLELLQAHGVTSLSAAPSLVGRLARHALASAPVRALSGVVVGGGPVSRRLCDQILRAFPAADAHVLYGATEAEPIATTRLAEVRDTSGEGFLVGCPVSSAALALDGGELLVRGSHVAGERGRWHRTGDLARLDDEGRVWLLGRVGSTVVHSGRELAPYAVEAAVLSLNGVGAAALVAHRRTPQGELAVELADDADADAVVCAARACLTRMGLSSLPVRVVARIPMDARHGSKVQRAELARLLERSST